MDFPSILDHLFVFLWDFEVCLAKFVCILFFKPFSCKTKPLWIFEMKFLVIVCLFVWRPSLFGQICLAKFVCIFLLTLPLYDEIKPLWIFVMIWCLKFDGFPIYSRSIVCLFVRRPSLFSRACSSWKRIYLLVVHRY